MEEQISFNQRNKLFTQAFFNQKITFQSFNENELLSKIKQFNNNNHNQQINQYCNIIAKDLPSNCSINKICKFICISSQCKKNPFICSLQNQQQLKINQKCSCYKNHKKCQLITYQNLLKQLQNKINRSINKSTSFKLYIQTKSFLVNYIIEQISEEFKQFQDWLQTLKQQSQSQSNLYLFGFQKNGYTYSNCKQKKLLMEKHLQGNHQNCSCVPIVSNSFNFKNIQTQQNKKIMRKIRSNYIKLIDFLQQTKEQIQTIQSLSCYMNFAEYQIFKFLYKVQRNQYFGFQKQSQKINPRLISIAYSLKNVNFYELLKNKKKSEKVMITGRFSLASRLLLTYQQISSKQYLQLNTFMEIRSSWLKVHDKKLNFFVKGSCAIDKDLFKLNENQLKQPNQYYANDGLQKVKNIWFSLNGYQTIFEQKVKKICIPLSIFHQSQIIPYSKINLSASNKMLYYCDNGSRQQLIYDMKAILQICCKSKNAKELYYLKFSDTSILKEYYEDQQFIIESTNSQNSLTTEQIYQLTLLNPNLENIHIPYFEDEKSVDVLKNLKKLKHISFGINKKTSNQQIPYYINYNSLKLNKVCNEKLFQYLISKQFNYLESITIFGSFEKDYPFSFAFQQLIKNNPLIKTIIINGQYDGFVSSLILQKIALYLPRLQNFIMRYSRSFGELIPLSKLFELKILDLSFCYALEDNDFKQIIKDKKQLTHVILNQNKWLSKNKLKDLMNECPSLQLINIKSTNIHSQDLLQLQKVPKLKCLMYGGDMNKIESFKNIQKISKFCPQLQRLTMINTLSVKDNYIECYLLSIMQNCKNLTHLNICNFSVCSEKEKQQQFFDQFRSLKIILKEAIQKQILTR